MYKSKEIYEERLEQVSKICEMVSQDIEGHNVLSFVEQQGHPTKKNIASRQQECNFFREEQQENDDKYTKGRNCIA